MVSLPRSLARGVPKSPGSCARLCCSGLPGRCSSESRKRSCAAPESWPLVRAAPLQPQERASPLPTGC
eukprot:scaffold317_cov260-Pinguiococcus_pyrenoidosus.AAC.42